MPYIKTWIDPEVVLRYKGVVVHEWYDDDDDESPSRRVYAVYEPDGVNSDSEPRFSDLEGDEPNDLVNIEDAAHLVGLDLEPENHQEILRRLIDAGHLTQAEFCWESATPWEPPDTQTLPLPFDEMKPGPMDGQEVQG